MLEKVKEYCKTLSEEDIVTLHNVGTRNTVPFNCEAINKLYDQFVDEIWDYLSDEAGTIGEEDVFVYLSHRRGKDWSKYVWHDFSFKQFLIEIAFRDALQMINEEKYN